MARRMSCALTIDAVRNRTKTVTRRDPATWRTLAAGDRLTLIEKGMGLPKGASQIRLAEVLVTDVRVVRLVNVTLTEIGREGFDPTEWSTFRWAMWWAESHGLRPRNEWELANIRCRRIEWRYLDGEMVICATCGRDAWDDGTGEWFVCEHCGDEWPQ